MIKRLKQDFPPKGTEFALKGVEYLDFINMIPKSAKHTTISRRIVEALARGAISLFYILNFINFIK